MSIMPAMTPSNLITVIAVIAFISVGAVLDTLSAVGFSAVVFYAFEVAAAKIFDLVTQLKIAAYLCIIQDAEAVDYGCRAAFCTDNLAKIQLQIRLTVHSEDHGIHSFEGLLEVLGKVQLGELLLVSEEPDQALSGSRRGNFSLSGLMEYCFVMIFVF